MSKVLSVIIPVFNSEDTINRAIRSFLQQKCDDAELIIIDGGSTDNTVSIIESFGHEVSFFLSEKDHGYADALNKGIIHSTGKYYMMLAADDYLLNNSLSCVIEKIMIDSDLHDVFCFDIIEKRSSGYYTVQSDNNLSKLLYCCSLKHPATIFRTDFVKKIGGYDDTLKIAADRELFLRLYNNRANFLIEHIPLVCFSALGMSSISSREKAIREDYMISVKYGLDETKAKKIYNEKCCTKPNLKLKKRLKTVLYKLYMLDIIFFFCKKPENYITRKRIKKLKIN